MFLEIEWIWKIAFPSSFDDDDDKSQKRIGKASFSGLEKFMFFRLSHSLTSALTRTLSHSILTKIRNNK